MKSIMISIQPQWVEKILNGGKIIEIRKTMPKCELPCKVYIYCSKGQELWGDGTGETWKGIDENEDMTLVHELNPTLTRLNGNVVAEFMLKNIVKFDIENIISLGKQQELMQKSKVGGLSLRKYLGNGIGYAWHIDNLKIYDKPKELDEFYGAKECPYKDWGDVNNIGCWEYCCEMFSRGECRFGHLKLERPPQSWCYVEELENE